MAKSTHTSAAPRKQTTKGPLPTRAKITHNQQKEESSSLSEVESSESDVEFSDMSTSQPKKMDNNKNKLDKTPKKTEIPIKSTNNVPENPKKSTKKIPENTNKSTKKIPEESSKKVSLKSAKKSEKKNEEIVKPVKKLDKKLEPVKIAKKSLVIPRSPPENPPEHSSEPIFHIQPPPQEIFQDQQECTQSIQQFALNRGYLIKIRNSCPTNTFYRCSRGGSASQNEHKDRKSKNPATSQLIGCPFKAKLIFQPASNNWLFTCTNPAHNHPEENNIDTSSQPLTLEIKEEIKELLRNGMKPKKIGEELQPEYPNHQITAARIYELGKQIKNQKTPENSLVQQLRESLAESSFFNETKYNKDVMLQSLSDSLKVKAQAILDNFDPEKLTKINSFFNNCLGKISNFALQKAQHNFTQTRESSPPTTCTNSHTTRTGIPCKHRILELLELGLLAQPEHFDPQWHLRNWERRHPKKTPGTERRHPKHDGNVGTLKKPLEPNVGTLNTIGNVGTLKKPLEPNEWQLGDLKTTENMNLDEEMEKIKTHLKSFDTLTQREKLDKIYEILDNNPHSLGKRENSAEEPTQQNKKLKIQPTSTPFIPSSKSSASITILPTKEELPSKSNWTSEWIKYLPELIQPYVEEIINVGSDGHCGFRVASLFAKGSEGSYLKIRQELLDEINLNRNFYLKHNHFFSEIECEETLKIIDTQEKGRVGQGHYMVMPLTGEIFKDERSLQVPLPCF
ncbi:hypothetical protein MJO29_002675 [Puccinia striiformis f. sp. tritici]|nr:hypothetical protein MJO29_002675 [Puccinia striiformis f. sp. tritici]